MMPNLRICVIPDKTSADAFLTTCVPSLENGALVNHFFVNN
jgi:hypothetical protein